MIREFLSDGVTIDLIMTWNTAILLHLGSREDLELVGTKSSKARAFVKGQQ